MQTISINNIKRKRVCDTLFENEWNYKEPDKLNKVFHICLDELLSWYSRKGNKITHIVADTIAENIASREGLSQLSYPRISAAVQQLVLSKLYKGLENPIFNYNTKLHIGKKYIEYSIPFISDGEKETTIIINNPSLYDKDLLAGSYEVYFSALWSFYAKSRYPKIVNIFIENNELKFVEFTPDQKNVKTYKLNINNMLKVSYSYKSPPPAEVCDGCSRRKECPILARKN